MPWVIRGGQPVREVKVTISPPEIVTTPDGFTCLICGKAYKTERGYENHLETHDG